MNKSKIIVLQISVNKNTVKLKYQLMYCLYLNNIKLFLFLYKFILESHVILYVF